MKYPECHRKGWVTSGPDLAHGETSRAGSGACGFSMATTAENVQMLCQFEYDPETLLVFVPVFPELCTLQPICSPGELPGCDQKGRDGGGT